jgi:8-oxo-dGTP pyrophosphatase MutT (NUDIX family)
MPMIDKVAWIRVVDGVALSTRSRGRDAFYFPGGKREAGESDVETLVREIREELSVDILAATARHLGTFEDQAHGHAAGTVVRMACYTADYVGELAADNEIEELAGLTYADRDRVSAVDQQVFDWLRGAGLLAATPVENR